MRRVWQAVTVLMLALAGLVPTSASAQTLRLAWDPNPITDLVLSYTVCIGTSSLTCNTRTASVLPITHSYTLSDPTPGVLYHFAVRANSLAGSSSYSAEVVASLPSLVQPANQSSIVNTPIAPLSFQVVDPDGGQRQFGATGLPFGLTLNPSTGQITGTPSGLGTYTVTITVFDGLGTSSRSFQWAILAPGSDVTAPAVAITSHTSGQTVTTSSVMLAGTASDAGAGGGGVSVSVNGQAATGGVAAGSGTASWSAVVALAVGANTITVSAFDSRGNTRTTQITLTRSTVTAPVTGVTMTAAQSSPQVLGTLLTFSASAAGGAAPAQYKWYARLGTGTQQMILDWSTAATLAWRPPVAGSYTVTVWARSAGVTTDAAQASAQRAVSIVASATMTSVSLSLNRTSPQALGSSITMSASGAGGIGPYQYRFWVQHSTTPWQIVRDWSTVSSHVWTPTINGSYQLAVWARSAGSTREYEVFTERSFQIGPDGATSSQPAPAPAPAPAPPTTTSPVTAVSIGTNLLSPQSLGNAIRISASALGGSGSYQYRFWVQPSNGPAVVVRDWSSTNFYTFTPPGEGTYTFAVWARNAGSTATWEAYNQMEFVVIR